MTRGPSRALAVVGIASAICFVCVRAEAIPASSAEVQDLARRAGSDFSALERLRSVDSVDGRPVDMRSVLASDDPATLSERLRILAEGAPRGDVDPASARQDAANILSGRRFQESQPPRPFQGPLDRLGDFLDKYLSDPVSRAFRALVRAIPGGATTVWILIVGAVVAVVVLITLRLARRRSGALHAEVHALRSPVARADPDDLERQAARAESAGDLETAIRLRFQAGLLRLDRAGAISYQPSITAGQVRRKLRSRPFDAVSTSFESVVYGGRAPDATDVETSKAGWRQVLSGTAA